jgi:signal peptidase II
MNTVGRVAALVLLLSTVGCDRVTKHIAATTLAGSPGRSYLGGIFRLEYAENSGAFLSLGSTLPDWARTALLIFAAAAGLIAVAVASIKLRWAGWPLSGAMLFIAGGASNLTDRIAHGRVVDFMNVGVGSLRTGIFNVADIALMVGVGLMVFGRRNEHHGQQSDLWEQP